MRDIRFRGRFVDNGEWVYGSLIGDDVIVGDIVEFTDEYFYTEFWYKVDPETVGQYTGLKDSEKAEIFGGDHLYAPDNLGDLEYVGTVEWDEEDCRWEVAKLHGRFEYIPDGCVVRGNKHDPELLEGGDKG